MLAELEHNLSRFNSRRSLGNGTLPNASSYSLNRGLTKDPSQMGSMIGGLSPDANRHGIHTIPKGDCAACDRPIIGQIVMAMGKMWHPEHYVCCHCGVELGQQNYIERGGKAYCENDYHDLFSPRCVVCNGAVKDRCVTAMGKNYHPQHFVCVECGRPFGPEGYHEKDGHAYCKTDFYRLFAPKCTGCAKPVGARFLTALGTTWHPECFACNDCNRQFNNGIYFEANGVPLCEQHFHERRGSLCGSCHGPINGKCVAALGQRFHPEHFGCSSCNRILNARNFKDHGGQALCQKCYEKTNPSFTVLSLETTFDRIIPLSSIHMMIMQTYKWPEIRKHDSFDSLWIVIHGKVYDVTPFIDDHPGGIAVLIGVAGGDATAAFTAAKHPASITERLAKLQIGTLAGA